MDRQPVIKIFDEKCVVILSSPAPDAKQFSIVTYLDESLSYVVPLVFEGYLGDVISMQCLMNIMCHLSCMF